jgi:hypothetical protein
MHERFEGLINGRVESAKKERTVMKRVVVAVLTTGTFAVGYFMGAGSIAMAEKKDGAPLRHVVMFQFKADTSADDKAAIEKAIGEFPSKFPMIKDMEWGTNTSTRSLNQGFEYCMFMTFADQQALDEYLPHRDHLAFVSLMQPHLEKLLVFDYYPQE